jgi:pyrroline-5-carboxylate reductase
MLAGKKIAVIGAGNMGRALLQGLTGSPLGAKAEVAAYDVKPEQVRAADAQLAARLAPDLAGAVDGARLVIVAVKPQDIDTLLDELAPHLPAGALVLSVAAGVPLSRLKSHLGDQARLVRSMPNIGALYGLGVTAVTRGAQATAEDLELAKTVLSTVGRVVEVREELMDAVTGLSGSGPAYVFLFIEALIEAGVAQGLGRDVARVLAGETVRGAAEIFVRDTRHPAELKDLVVSPGGTTAAALALFEAMGLRGIVIDAVAAATERSRELGQK